MSESYVIDAKQYSGRKIVIDVPPEPRRQYIACNKKDWCVSVDSSLFGNENDFLWNYEQGKKVIYSSNILKLTQNNPLEMNFNIPLFTLTPRTVTLNDKPYMELPECIHDFSSSEPKVALNRIVAEGAFECPAVIFSNKVDNGFGIYIEIYLETAEKTIPIWEKTINLTNSNDYRRAKYKSKEYYVWDSSIASDFNFDTLINSDALVASGVSLGVAVKFICTSELFMGQKEDLNPFFFKMKNFHYILQFEDY